MEADLKNLRGLSDSDTRDILEVFLEKSFEAVIITDGDPVDHKILYVNPRFCKMTGYSKDELYGNSPRMLAGERTNKAVTERLKAALAKGEPFIGAATNYRKDGSSYPVQWNIYPICHDDGKPQYFVSMQKDLTDLKSSLNRLKSSSKHFRLFLDELMVSKGAQDAQVEKVQDALKANAEVLAQYVNTTEPDLDDDDDFDFFDFDDAALDDSPEEQRDKLSAKDFISTLDVEDHVIRDISTVAISLDKLIEAYEPIDLNESERKELIEELQEMANAIFYVEEFIDVSISISELAVGMYHFVDQPIDFMISEALKGLIHDLCQWVSEVFVNETAEDIHWLDNSMVGSCKQILVFSRLKDE